MPIYEYICKNCKDEFIISLTLKELSMNPQIKCPRCDSKEVQKKIGTFFAKTDKKS
ncbi:MAG: zinc ribbon domain-containing protein [Nitrospirota bacterium]